MKADNISLAFGTEVVYDNASFQIGDDAKVGIVGVNGAGKSTLLRVILGEQKLDGGSISFGNVRLGFLPQEIAPLSGDEAKMTVWDYIKLGRPIDEIQDKLNAEYEKLAKYPESNAILGRINDLQDLMDSYDPYVAEVAMLEIVEKMDLGELVDRKMGDLSGGQKSKVAFARLLFENSPYILLDEPTNHLDAKTKRYVTNFLRNYHGTALIVSHDRAFLDEVTNQTLFINKIDHKIKLYKGNYTEFRKQRAAEMAARNRLADQQEKEIRRIEEFVERARAAKRSNTALIKQGHVREKMLERKLAEKVEREQEYAVVNFNITPEHLGSRTPLELQNIKFGYDEKLLYERLSFSLTRGEKFLVVGENGIGKSTLLKLIVGQLNPLDGSVIFGSNIKVAYYAQELELLDERKSVFDNVKSYDFTDTQIRGILANFLFRDDDLKKPVNVLSPGEKARVALCKVFMMRANLVILDEPTNHFDPETQAIIGENFKNYPGTLLIVSHNPEFVEKIGVSRMLILPDGIIKNYSPELMEYYYYLNSDLL